MEVYALSGPSGTGKSSSALLFAHNHGIPAIIDDGLLIYKGQKQAGYSAKYETNYIKAVKRAIFHDEAHRQEVINAIRSLPIEKILLIGTSKRMVQLIAKQLELGDIDYYFDIEDIRSSSEIKMAQFVRKTKGEHVIPIPSVQVEQSFFKRLIQKGAKVFSLQRKVIGETSIVRPNFQMGAITISPEALKQIVAIRCEQTPEISNYQHIRIDIESHSPTVQLEIHLKIEKQMSLIKIIKDLQQAIKQDFQLHLNIDMEAIDIQLTNLIFEPKQTKVSEIAAQ